MATGTHILRIARQALKFSAAHMTVFPDGSATPPKERLHGHNYQTELLIEIQDGSSLKNFVPFDIFKNAMQAICETWDDRLLLAKDCPFLKIVKQTETELEFTLCGKRYVLPREDVLLLPIENTTSEALSETFLQELRRRLPESIWKSGNIRSLEVRIEESPGLGAAYHWQVA